MSVTRIHEDPRVTKPYTEEQWAEIEELGHQVDADLKRGDVRLTMGGEPTFVSIDDMDGAEWTSAAAVGPMKYRRSDELLRRLRDRFALRWIPASRAGKMVSGRIAATLVDGRLLAEGWAPDLEKPALVADEQKPNHVTENDASAFAVRLCGRLGLERRFLVPGYEDVWYYLWKERRLPVNVNPLESNLDNPEERSRLAKIFEDGLDKVVGYALPLRRDRYTDGTGAWAAGPWFFRSERMYLVPGDSPMGFRLPLDSIPWVTKSDYPHMHPEDPWSERAPLPPMQAIAGQRYISGGPEPMTPRGFIEQTLEPESAASSRPGTSLALGEGRGRGEGAGEEEGRLQRRPSP